VSVIVHSDSLNTIIDLQRQSKEVPLWIVWIMSSPWKTAKDYPESAKDAARRKRSRAWGKLYFG